MRLFRICQARIDKLEALYDPFPSGRFASFIMGTDLCLAAVALGTGPGACFVLCRVSSVRRSSIIVSVDCSLEGLASRYFD
jgi:hypothetical protein